MMKVKNVALMSDLFTFFAQICSITVDNASELHHLENVVIPEMKDNDFHPPLSDLTFLTVTMHHVVGKCPMLTLSKTRFIKTAL